MHTLGKISLQNMDLCHAGADKSLPALGVENENRLQPTQNRHNSRRENEVKGEVSRWLSLSVSQYLENESKKRAATTRDTVVVLVISLKRTSYSATHGDTIVVRKSTVIYVARVIQKSTERRG